MEGCGGGGGGGGGGADLVAEHNLCFIFTVMLQKLCHRYT